MAEERLGQGTGTTCAGDEFLDDLLSAVLHVRRLLDPASLGHFGDRKSVEFNAGRRLGKATAVPGQYLGGNTQMPV